MSGRREVRLAFGFHTALRRAKHAGWCRPRRVFCSPGFSRLRDALRSDACRRCQIPPKGGTTIRALGVKCAQVRGGGSALGRTAYGSASSAAHPGVYCSTGFSRFWDGRRSDARRRCRIPPEGGTTIRALGMKCAQVRDFRCAANLQDGGGEGGFTHSVRGCWRCRCRRELDGGWHGRSW